MKASNALILAGVLASALASGGLAFECDGGRWLHDDRVNDDYCDCEDGADEAGTGACATLRPFSTVPRFQCADTKGYQPLDVPAHVVGDGICDCCDGSDETGHARIQCPNECERMADEARRAERERQQALQLGYDRFLGYSDMGSREFQTKVADVHETMTALTALEEDIAEYERRKAELSTRQEQERDQHKEDANARWRQALALSDLSPAQKNDMLLTVVAGASDTGMESLMGYLTNHFPSELTDSVDDVEVFSLAAEASEIISAGSEKQTVAVALDGETPPHTTSRNLETVLAELSQALPLDKAPDMDQMIIELLTDLKQFSRGAELSLSMRRAEASPADLDFGSLVDPNSWKLQELESLEIDLTSRKDEKRQLEGKKRDMDFLQDTDFGPTKAYFVLHQKCFERQVSGFKYSVCPFGDAKQDHTSLGKFSSWKEKDVMLFENGSKCWNGPKRSLQVTFTCGNEDLILSVDEPETCVYTAVFQSPAACGDVEPQAGSPNYNNNAPLQ